MKALIPAAGLGTRFLPATKAVPKELLPVVNKPVIQYVVEEGLASGADEVVIINSRSKKAIEEHFAPDAALEEHLRTHGKDALADAVAHAGQLPVSFVYQDEPLGLGHAVHCGAEACGSEPFFVLLGDVVVPDGSMCTRMREISEEHGGASVIAVLPVEQQQVSRFGVIAGTRVSGSVAFDANGLVPVDGSAAGEVWKVERLVEKPPVEEAPSNLTVFGRYLLSPRVMELLAHVAPGAGGEIQLTDALDAVLAEEEMYALVIGPDDGFDTGTVESWLDTNNRLLARFS